ncbi:hypothetical protein CROQUDRAFT_192603 [Cronartium quercuum f. sp. fusiforme G11]|uniref:Cytochrome P450 n=1 Tax=Cronartium quercuum f. sp. fusiforme G11 TaxID=708437 RepID=A0A9P6T972_9BASI|nr:hypothetical protein CROQUDRAFT_192603 [Cronartium quercuum f. sp. fusiforme G11]
MTSEHVSRGLRLSFMQYNDLWRRERKLLHQLTQPRAAVGYERIQLQESAQLALDLLNEPEQHWAHAQRYAGSTVLQITFNRRAKTNKDGSITRMRTCNDQMVRTAVPGAYLVDSLPLLNLLPTFLSPWKVHAASVFSQTRDLFEELYRESVADKIGGECFVKRIEELRDEYELEDDQAFFLAGAMFGAGSDTTADAIETFIFAMTLYPDVAQRAQAELDTVVGRNRMPEFGDQAQLIYCQAVVQELMRWRTVIPGGLAHMVTSDDIYEGYAIPKGASVVANHWALHLDSETYIDPSRFNPERFIDSSGALTGSKWSERGHHAFGFGRRICPGIHIAGRSIFITAVRILWTLNFSQDPNHSPLRPDHPFSTGFSSHPHTFPAMMSPRGDWVGRVVRETLESFGPGPVGM